MNEFAPGLTEITPHNVLLKSNEDKYHSLVEDVLVNTAAGILILDADFKVVWVSQALDRY